MKGFSTLQTLFVVCACLVGATVAWSFIAWLVVKVYKATIGAG